MSRLLRPAAKAGSVRAPHFRRSVRGPVSLKIMLLPLLILASFAYVAFAASVVIKEKRGGDARGPDAPHPVMKFVLAGGVPQGKRIKI